MRRHSLIVTCDLDDVICSEETTFDRSLAIPIYGAKEGLARLKSQGHTIIIETARGWAEYRMTKTWLDRHEMTYDILLMGRAISHLRIDDRAIKFTDWESIVRLIENSSKASLPVKFPSDEHFLMENRRVIFEYLSALATRDLPEPIVEIGPMERRGNAVIERFPEFYVNTRALFEGKDFHTFGPDGNVDCKGSVTDLNSHFAKDAAGTIIMLSVLEHVDAFWHVPSQCWETLKQNGLLFLQVPWNLRFHGPKPDYWRFSDDGLHYLFDPYFEFVKLDLTNTPGRALMPICLTAELRRRD